MEQLDTPLNFLPGVPSGGFTAMVSDTPACRAQLRLAAPGNSGYTAVLARQSPLGLV